MREPLTNKIPVVVNLDLPDALLFKIFKQWVTFARMIFDSSTYFKRYKKPDFESWYKFGVLPWLDLIIWSKEVRVSIPNRVMALAIFQFGDGGEETIRKTTKPMANSLIEDKKTDGYPLSSLAAQAAMEMLDEKLEDF